MKKKIFTIFLILLFLISIETVSAVEINNTKKDSESFISDKSTDSELVEIPVQISSGKDIEVSKIYLTQQEKGELDVLFDMFKSDIENAKTLKESVNIYRNMVVSLNDLGLLPDGMTVMRAQRLILGRFYFLDKLGLLSDKMPLCKAQQSSANVFENSNCLVSGSSSNSSPDVGLGLSLRYFIYSLTGFWVGGIYYGWCVPDGSLWWWASGGIETASLQEKWSYEGDFVGDIYWDGGPGGGFFIGASGFSGMYYADHYFGYARQVKITTEKWIS